MSYQYKPTNASLLLVSKGAKFEFQSSSYGGKKKMDPFGSHILKDPEIFLKCGDTILENLVGGLNILAACLREQEDPEISTYANLMLPNLIDLIVSNDFSFKVLKAKCKTIDDIQELSFQSAKVLEVYEKNKDSLDI